MTPVVSAPNWTRNGRGHLTILRKYLAANLNRLIRERDLNQRSFAKDLGITEGYLSRILNEHKFPSEEVIERMAKLLNIEPDELLRRSFNGSHSQPVTSDPVVRVIRDAARAHGYDLVKKKT